MSLGVAALEGVFERFEVWVHFDNTYHMLLVFSMKSIVVSITSTIIGNASISWLLHDGVCWGLIDCASHNCGLWGVEGSETISRVRYIPLLSESKLLEEIAQLEKDYKQVYEYKTSVIVYGPTLLCWKLTMTPQFEFTSTRVRAFPNAILMPVFGRSSDDHENIWLASW
jgi:hypothetical protein